MELRHSDVRHPMILLQVDAKEIKIISKDNDNDNDNNTETLSILCQTFPVAVGTGGSHRHSLAIALCRQNTSSQLANSFRGQWSVGSGPAGYSFWPAEKSINRFCPHRRQQRSLKKRESISFIQRAGL